jgi:hypothetical protein
MEQGIKPEDIEVDDATKRKPGESKEACMKRKMKINTKKYPFKQAIAISMKQCGITDEAWVFKLTASPDDNDNYEPRIEVILDADETFRRLIRKNKNGM